MYDTLTGETWRFHVSEHDGSITRGRLYQIDPSMTTDLWRNYWEGDFTVAFIDSGYSGTQVVTDDEALARRVADAFERTGRSQRYLDLAAQVIAAAEGATASTEARFIRVGLDRGSDLYALSYDGDPTREWADEIEGINFGDCFRIEVEEYAPGMGPGGIDWVPTEEVCEEWHVEAKAREVFETREFPLAEFPAELALAAPGD